MDKEEEMLEKNLDFLEKLDLDNLKYQISEELRPLTGKAGEVLESAEKGVVSPEIEIRFSEDKLKAYLKVTKPGKPIPVTEDDLRNKLKEEGVVKGILEKSIEEILVERLVGQEVLVAKGMPPTEGKDGYVKSILDPKKVSPEECIDPRGRVDFKRVRQSNLVEVGEIIAEKVPPVQGKEGYDVTGKILKPKLAKEVDFKLTPDIGLNPENKSQIIALKNGVLKKNYTIDEINVINGNVDFSTGNIDYSKSLVIKGDVKSGFKVYSGENIEIRGCVEDAEVVAEGDVVVKQGFLGTGKGYIKGKDVSIGHIKQQEVFATGDIVVGGEVMHSTLHAAGFIKLIGIRGVVIGGSLIAEKGIEVVSAGNAQNIKTLLHVGCNGEVMDMEEKLQILYKNDKKAETALRIIEAARNLKELSEKMKQRQEKVLATKNYISAEIKKLEKKRIEVIENLLLTEKPTIKVSQNIFSNVTVQIGHLKKLITQQMRDKTFRYHNHKIFIGA